MQGYFYEVLYSMMSAALDAAIGGCGLPAQEQDDTRNRFLMYSTDAHTELTEYPAPMLLQLNGYRKVCSFDL